MVKGKDRGQDTSHFWLIMFAFWVVFVILSLVERSRIIGVVVAIIGVLFFIFYNIEKRYGNKEGKYANRNK